MLKICHKVTAIVGVVSCALQAGCMAGDDVAAGDPGGASGDPPQLSPGAGAPASDRMRWKAAPVRPPVQPGVITDGTLPWKPARTAPSPMPSVGTTWTITLTASPASQWATAFTTLTATTNMDVGPTPYYIRIRDGETGVFIASCPSGTSCSLPVTRPNADYTSFTAVVTDFTDSVELASACAADSACLD